MFKPDAVLERWYADYNKRFFDGRLPKDALVGFNPELEENILGLSIHEEDSDTKHQFHHIHVNPLAHSCKQQIQLTLLHEMAHIAIFPYVKHGKKFNDEMLRLATRGAFNGLW